jgi:hypothetical protein
MEKTALYSIAEKEGVRGSKFKKISTKKGGFTPPFFII